MAYGQSQSKATALPRAGWWAAVPLIVIQIIWGMWYMPVMSFFPIYLKEQLGLAPVQISAVVAIGQVASMLTAIAGGAITGLLGSKWVLVCGLGGMAVASLAFQVHQPWLVAAFWFVSGISLALHTVGGSSYLTRLSGHTSLGMLAAFYALSTTVGGAIGNPLAGIVIDRRGFAAFGLAGTALLVLTTLGAILGLAYLGDRDSQRVSLRTFWSGALPIIRKPTVRTLTGMRALPTIFYGMMTVLVPLLINDLSGSKTLVAVYATANLVLASGAQLVAGKAADRFGARRPTFVFYGVLIIAALGLAATATTLWGLFAFGVLGVAAAWGLSTLFYLWVSDGLPKTEHAWAFGLLHAVWSLSMVVGSLLAGWLVSPAAGLPFLVAGVLNLASLYLTSAYYARLAAQRPA